MILNNLVYHFIWSQLDPAYRLVKAGDEVLKYDINVFFIFFCNIYYIADFV